MSSNICFAFSIHKAGSTLFYNLLQRSMYRANELGVANAMRYLSIPDQLFNAGVPEEVLIDENFATTHRQSFCDDNTLYGGFRFVPGFATNDFLAGKRTMILVRDPRDVLTSLYFSIVKSHTVPTGEGGTLIEGFREWATALDIDQVVLRQARKGAWLQRFSKLGELKQFGASWRYEDIVFEKARWLDEILAYLDIDLPAASRKEFVNAEDIRPEEENADKHIRQVEPGDHRRKLKPETIEELNVIFKDVLDTWGYA